MNKNKTLGTEHLASARAQNLPISTKHSVEISRYLRYKKTAFAKSFLEQVIRLRKAVPFYRFDQDLGHKAGMAAGRYPQKAAKEFLRLVKAVEANAQSKGLNSSVLKITKILANKASIPITGGRHRRGTKRTHLEIEVREMSGKKEGSRKEKPEKAAERVLEPVKIAPKIISVKKEISLPVVKDEKKETKVLVTAETQPEMFSRPEPVSKLEPRTEQKTEYHFQTKSRTESRTEQLGQAKKIEEPSSAELLRRAQEKAAQLNNYQKEERKRVKEVNEVESLYDQLKKKGSLREQTGGGRR